MTFLRQIPLDPAARRARARRVAAQAEADCAAQCGRPDLLLRAALHRVAAGDLDLARAQTAALLDRVDEDPGYAPPWLVRQAIDLRAEIDQRETEGDPPDRLENRR